MSFLSGLGKVLGIGAGVAGAPFTGGASLTALLPAILGAGSSVAGLVGQNQSQNRQQRNDQGMDQNRLLASLFGTQQGAQTGQYGINQGATMNALQGQANQQQNNVGNDLNRRQFALNAPSTRAHQAVTGSILQSLQPAKMSGGSAKLQSHTPHISGGLSAANLGPGAREAGKLMEGNALNGLWSGDTFDALPETDFMGGVMKPPDPLALPQFQAMQQPGKAESILGLLGMYNPLLQAFKKQGGASGNDGEAGGRGSGGY